MTKVNTTLSITVISLVGSALSLSVMGAMALVPFTITVVAFGAILTAISIAIGHLVVRGAVNSAGHDIGTIQTAKESTSVSHPDFSVTDPLTRTPNRRGITIGIMDAMALGERYGNPLSVAKLDLDHLDSINKKYGNEVGDRILAGVAAMTTDALRMPDKIGRYADDEFLLVMPETGIDDAYKIVNRVHHLISEHTFDIDGDSASITTSVGVTEYKQGDDLESLLSRVQKGVDESRNAGRNRVTRV